MKLYLTQISQILLPLPSRIKTIYFKHHVTIFLGSKTITMEDFNFKINSITSQITLILLKNPNSNNRIYNMQFLIWGSKPHPKHSLLITIFQQIIQVKIYLWVFSPINGRKSREAKRTKINWEWDNIDCRFIKF